jgi:DNA modification methylase
VSGLAPVTIVVNDALLGLRTVPTASVQCVVTSPPYWGLRDYGMEGQIGLEKTPSEYVRSLVRVFREVRRVLRADGTLWLNLGDSYASNAGGYNCEGSMGASHNLRISKKTMSAVIKNRSRLPAPGLKPKDLVGIPWRVAFALQKAGWWLRSDIIWHKPNPMPESVTDRPTKSHEYLFLLTKSQSYYYDHEAIKEPAGDWHASVPGRDSGPAQDRRSSKPRECVARGGFNGKTGSDSFRAVVENRNKRSVWTVSTAAFSDAHFATFPPDLIKPCILAGTKAGDVVLDPFAGSGTTGKVALSLGRRAILIELNPAYAELIRRRTNTTVGLAL